MISMLWPAFSVAASVVARPTQHGSGVDDVVCLVLPMVILGVVFLLAMRKGDVDEPEDPEDEVSEDAAAEGPGAPEGGEQQDDRVDREP